MTQISIVDCILKLDSGADFFIESLAVECPAAILGGGGSGKTNLIRILCGVELIERGQIFIGGTEVGGIKPKERNFALISKDTPLFDRKSVRFNLEYPLKKHKKTGLSVANFAEDIMEKRAGEVDEKTRIDLYLYRALMRNPDLILIDEPYNFTSQPEYFVERAAQILPQDRVILATFDYDLAAKIAENYIFLRSNRVIFCGNNQQLLATENNYIKSFIS